MFYAESEGFEPPNPLRSTVFKTAAINHSANSPFFLFALVRYWTPDTAFARLGLQI